MKIRRDSRSGRAGRRAGFTLIELLVVIAIIGVLAGLILPGVQAARGAARRAECLNHLRNLGTAMHNHAAQKGHLPAAGRWDVTAWPTAGSPTAGYGEWQNLSTVASTALTMRYSWCLDLLPFLERSDVYDQWDFSSIPTPSPLGADANARGGFGSYWIDTTNKKPSGGNLELSNTTIRVFTCPADATTIPGKGNISYALNGGYSYHWRLDYMTSANGSGTMLDRTNLAVRRFSDNLKHSGVFFTQTSKEYKASFNPPAGTDDQRDVTLESIKDGTGTTVMIAENINVGPGAVWEDPNQYPSNWACPHPWNTSFFVNGAANGLDCVPTNSAGYVYPNANTRGLQAPPLTPTGREGGINGDLTGANEGSFPYPNSGHTGIVNVLMCDGAARAINESIDAKTWARLVSSNGNRMVNPSTGVANGVAQENVSGVGFTQNPVSNDF